MRFLVSAMIAATLLTVPVSAVEIKTEIPQEKTTDASDSRIGKTRGEVYKWYYRTYKGREQMRLWSITEGRWVTDWIYC